MRVAAAHSIGRCSVGPAAEATATAQRELTVARVPGVGDVVVVGRAVVGAVAVVVAAVATMAAAGKRFVHGPRASVTTSMQMGLHVVINVVVVADGT